MFRKILITLFVLVLVGCSGGGKPVVGIPIPQTAKAVQEQAPAVTQVVEVVKVSLADPFANLPNCPYVDTGSSQPLNNDGSIPIVQKEKLWEADLTKNGCSLIFEGRIIPGENLHRVIVLRSLSGQNTEFVKDGKFVYAEGSIWGYDRSWNMDDFSAVKPPIAAEFVNAKRQVMKDFGYDWKILVYLVTGQVIEFGPGEKWDGVMLGDNCSFDQPQQIPIHGEFLSGNKFAAAIGATDCRTVAWIDGSSVPEQWSGQRDAANKVVYKTIEAWLFPSSWTQKQIDEWIASH